MLGHNFGINLIFGLRLILQAYRKNMLGHVFGLGAIFELGLTLREY